MDNNQQPNPFNQPITNQNTNQSVLEPTPPPIPDIPQRGKVINGKTIITLLSLVLLIAGVGAGIGLVSQQQLLQQKAALLPSEAINVASLPVLYPEPGKGSATVYGRICPYEKYYSGGTVVFYEINKQSVVTQTIQEGEASFGTSLPYGDYIALFDSNQDTLPSYFYTQYVKCGLNPNTCTNHDILTIKVSSPGEFGQVNLCDNDIDISQVPKELL